MLFISYILNLIIYHYHFYHLSSFLYNIYALYIKHYAASVNTRHRERMVFNVSVPIDSKIAADNASYIRVSCTMYALRLISSIDNSDSYQQFHFTTALAAIA